MSNVLNLPSEETLERIADALENNAQSEVDAHNTDPNAHEGAIYNVEQITYKNAGNRNSIFRGKYLGTSYTAQQKAMVVSGTFDDIYVGDYWTIGGVNWRVAHINYFIRSGDVQTTANHLVIVPDNILYTHAMNDTNTTTTGYVNSKMYTEGLDSALSTINSAFGSANILAHNEIFCTASADGKASAWAWQSGRKVDLMSEAMIYGTGIWGTSSFGQSAWNAGVGCTQLALFALDRYFVNTRQNYWLRDVSSATNFALVDSHGSAYYNSASYAFGVRPYFLLS